MGSDRSPLLLYEAAVEVASGLSQETTLVLLGTHSAIDQIEPLAVTNPFSKHIEFVRVAEEITMDDAPLLAVRRKKESSMLVGMERLRVGELDGLISAGNTGALVASASLTLPMLPGVERPALLATLPTIKGPVAVIDIGGNVICKPKHLLQYARMGSAYQQCREGIVRPRLGLLNIGTEARKGTKAIREAYDLLSQQVEEGVDLPFDFKGNVEGREAFRGVVDVLVSEGFTGNVFLKTAEGISSFILDYLYDAFAGTMNDKVKEVIDTLHKRVDYAEYPGAIVCGVEGVVVKCHGYSCKQAMTNGIKGALTLVEEGMISKMKSALEQLP